MARSWSRTRASRHGQRNVYATGSNLRQRGTATLLGTTPQRTSTEAKRPMEKPVTARVFWRGHGLPSLGTDSLPAPASRGPVGETPHFWGGVPPGGDEHRNRNGYRLCAARCFSRLHSHGGVGLGSAPRPRRCSRASARFSGGVLRRNERIALHSRHYKTCSRTHRTAAPRQY
jgi:hypothetical protein